MTLHLVDEAERRALEKADEITVNRGPAGRRVGPLRTTGEGRSSDR
jgi:hypothetical protein